jgi:hypothetical protein
VQCCQIYQILGSTGNEGSGSIGGKEKQAILDERIKKFLAVSFFFFVSKKYFNGFLFLHFFNGFFRFHFCPF